MATEKRRKKQVEIIRFDGFSSDTVREFEPKAQEDTVWEQYFLGAQKASLPQEPPPKSDLNHENKIVNLLTPVETPVETPVDDKERRQEGVPPAPRSSPLMAPSHIDKFDSSKDTAAAPIRENGAN